MAKSEHPFDKTRERAVRLKETVDGIEGALSSLNKQGVNQGIASTGPIQQLGGESWATLLGRLRAVLDTIERLRVKSSNDKGFFEALYGPPLAQIEPNLNHIANVIHSISVQELAQAQNRANQALSQA